MIEPTCLGCQLANGQAQAHIVYENEWVTCILDIAPLNEGHVLILPKKHYAEVTDIDEITSLALMKASLLISRVLTALFQPDGVTLLQNGGSFNDLDHVHIHVFPRYKGDGFGWIEPVDRKNNRNRLKETAAHLINYINDLSIINYIQSPIGQAIRALSLLRSQQKVGILSTKMINCYGASPQQRRLTE
ncbi:hypothetical protein A8709_19110 [Paenibacillus pectinilyticus]|uniref:HIT domain-containing protein n=1 Tax=Paenibacillus pectinilyticus TaxID=512399 RepID=A0A1C0ZZX5_9BACL|nr:HIT family protein [Paenibacillus pectinilyticus]OCT13696.1 hypothetical protein A8709_19110 [Paenibacillus pectinilyticus]